MIEPLSQTAKAFRDTTISRSSLYQFGAVSRQWGIPHVAISPESDWREVVRSNAMGPRGVYGAVFEFVRYALRQFDTLVSVTVDPANPQRVTAAAGTPFLQAHIGGLLEHQGTGEIYSITGPADIATSAGAWVELLSYSVLPYHTGVTFTAVGSFDVVILPFTIVEEPGRVIVRVSPASISASPPTYLQPGSTAPAVPGVVNQPVGSEAATYNGGSVDPAPNAAPTIGADTRPVGEPFGGHLQADEIDEDGAPLTTGPMPPYLSGGAVFDEFREILDALLAAGVVCFFEKGGA